MSIDRKKRLRKLAGTMMGLVGLTTPGQRAASGIDQNTQQMSTTNKLLAGSALLATGLTGVGIGINVWDHFGKKENAQDEEYRKLLLETARDDKEAKANNRKLEENRKRVREENGLTKDDVNRLLANLNAVLGGTGLTEDTMLANLGTPEGKKLIAEGKKDAAANHDCRAKLMDKIAEIIRENLTEDKVKRAMARLEALTGEGETQTAIGTAMLTGITWASNGDNHYVTDWGESTGRGGAALAAANVNIKINGGNPGPKACLCYGTGKELDARQLQAGDELLPEGLKGLLGGRLPVAVMLPSLSVYGLPIAQNGAQWTKNEILTHWKPINKGGTSATREDARMIASNGKIELDLVIGSGLKAANLSEDTPVARIGIGQIDKAKNKNMTTAAKQNCYKAIAQCVDKVGFGL